MNAGAAVMLQGTGVHTGFPSELTFIRRDATPEHTGLRFFFPSFAVPLKPADLMGLRRRAHRSTVLEGEASRIRTPEHLLAAALFFRDAPCDIRCSAEELPGLDGSALPFRDALEQLAPDLATAPAWSEYACALDWEHRWDGGFLRVRPAPTFRARYEIERSGLRQSFELEDAETAWREILSARSFVFHREWRAAVDSASGQMAGANLDSGLLLAETEAEHRGLSTLHPEWGPGPFPLLHPSGWRVEREPAKHKILDLLGDLAVLDLRLPKLEIEIRNGGHFVHHLLLEQLTHGWKFGEPVPI